MSRIIALFIAIMILFYWTTHATNQDFEVALSIPSDTIAISDTIDLTITVKQLGWANIGNIKIEWIKDFTVTWTRNSSKFSFNNWKSASIIEKVLSLTPRNEGTFTLGPASLDYNWNTVVSNTVTVKVASSSSINKAPDKASTDDIFPDQKKSFLFSNYLISPELWLFVLLVILVIYIKKSKNSNKPDTEIKASINLNIEDKDFLDNALNCLEKYIIKNNWLDWVKVSFSQIHKLESNKAKSEDIKEIISDIFKIKNKKTLVTSDILYNIKERVTNYI